MRGRAAKLTFNTAACLTVTRGEPGGFGFKDELMLRNSLDQRERGRTLSTRAYVFLAS